MADRANKSHFTQKNTENVVLTPEEIKLKKLEDIVQKLQQAVDKGNNLEQSHQEQSKRNTTNKSNFSSPTSTRMKEDRSEVEISEELFQLITRFQDEVHNTAIGYHKKLRNKSMTKSVLDEIKGIGDSKKKELLTNFDSIDEIANASIEDLTKVHGINENLAKEILNSLNGEKK